MTLKRRDRLAILLALLLGLLAFTWIARDPLLSNLQVFGEWVARTAMRARSQEKLDAEWRARSEGRVVGD